MGFTEIGGQDCLWICDVNEPIDTVNLMLQDGNTIRPGQRLKRIGGMHTSARYANIDMLPGHYLRYVGKVGPADRRVVLFETASITDAYVGLLEGVGMSLFYYTPSCAGRIVETTLCEFYEGDAA